MTAAAVGAAAGAFLVVATLLLCRHVSERWARGLMDNGDGFGGWDGSRRRPRSERHRRDSRRVPGGPASTPSIAARGNARTRGL